MNGDAKFAIFRDHPDGFMSIGPMARRLTIEQAREEIAAFKRRYPNQDFVIMGEVGTARRSDRVTVKVCPPDLGATNVVNIKPAKATAR